MYGWDGRKQEALAVVFMVLATLLGARMGAVVSQLPLLHACHLLCMLCCCLVLSTGILPL